MTVSFKSNKSWEEETTAYAASIGVYTSLNLSFSSGSILYDSPMTATPPNGSISDGSLSRIDSPSVGEIAWNTHYPVTDARQGWWEGLKSLFRPESRVEKDARRRIADILKKYPQDYPDGFPQDLEKRRVVHEVLKTLWKAFHTGIHDELNSLPSGRAQIAMDIMQGILSHVRSQEDEESPVIQEVGWLLRRRLQKLACEASVLPIQMFLENVQRQPSPADAVGGFSDIFRGTLDDQTIAIKHLRVLDRVTVADRDKVRKLLYREAVLWYNIDHSNILTFTGVSERIPQLPGLSFVLPWAEHMDLARYLDNLRSEGLSGKACVQKINKWLFDIAKALRYLHKHGIAHGDLRGVNVLVDSKEVPLLADFGLAVILGIRDSVTEASATKATAWMAPELMRPPRRGQITRSTSFSDMYSLGCLCVELYRNGSPFGDMEYYQIIMSVLNGQRPSRPDFIDDSLWQFVTKCFRARPENRPTAEEALKVLSLLI
ncbi:hypothetical protein NLI96_g6028 [Meripilus lineatus]|uniref:Protein kinase domain-containing protein n=1 Tax=Meripilus lineatus TaxID=2056292 RepID=A0AAD5YEA6_9APHY|nr:hypothetical protein NLI96_g6028 [Physisporinus lineatus]